MTVMFVGPVMTGNWLPGATVRFMLLVTMPALLLAMSEYFTLSATCALVMYSVLVVLPAMIEPLASVPSVTGTPLVSHCSAGAGMPETTGLMVTVSPTLAAWSLKPVMLGVTMTESVILPAFVPKELAATNE